LVGREVSCCSPTSGNEYKLAQKTGHWTVKKLEILMNDSQSDDDEFIHPEMLWMLGDERPGSLEEIQLLLDSGLLANRRIAAYELGNFNEPAVVEKLHGFLKDPDIHVRLCSIQALANLEDKTAVEPLCEMLTQDNIDFTIRTNILRTLGELRDSRALPTLIPLLTSEDAFVRYDAAFALGELGDEEAIPHLKAIVADEAMPEETDEDGELIDTCWSVGENAKKAINRILGLEGE